MLKDILLHVTDFMYGIVGFILLMSIVVFIHEFGHYYAARLCNVRVEIFSIGFGKKAFSFIDRAGCQWAISYLPIGGYVKFFGDKSGASNADNDVLDAMTEEDKKVSFHFKNLWQKIFIVAAGPLANFILCFVILWGLFFFRGVGHSDPYIMDVLPDMPAAEAGLKRGDKILTIDGFAIESVQQSRTELIKTFGRTTNIEILRGDDVKIFLLTPVMREMQGQEIPVVGILFHGAPYVGQVEEGSPAFMAGLQQNDKILQVNGKGILTSADVQMAVREARQGDISLKILRDNMQQDMSVTPILRKDKEGRDIPVIGIAFERANFTFRQYDVSASATEAYNMTISIASLTWAFLKSLVQGYASTDHLSGPIKIGSFAGDALQQDSFVIFINLMAWISMSIGLVNLMPVPMLDGGHIVLYLFELITRIKPSRKFQEYAFKTGFIIVMSLMVFTVLNDLGIVNYIKNLGKI